MCFNQRKTEIAVISCNGFIHCWDANRFRQIMSKKLPHGTENVCLAVDNDSSIYAVGSKQNTDLLDARTFQVRCYMMFYVKGLIYQGSLHSNVKLTIHMP